MNYGASKSRDELPRKSSFSGTGAGEIAHAPNEGLREASLAIAQELWGRGNLSPLDVPFSALALIRLIPSGGFGFIGRHLGQRLRKYADDTGAIIDAAEVDSRLTHLYAKRKSSVRPAEWGGDTALFKANRHNSFIVFQASFLGTPLKEVYSNTAVSLKQCGKLFAADLMEASLCTACWACQRCRADCENLSLAPLNTYSQTLESCGFAIDAKFDLTLDMLTSIRHGLSHSAKLLEKIKGSKEEWALQRIAAFGVQRENWRTLYYLAE